MQVSEIGDAGVCRSPPVFDQAKRDTGGSGILRRRRSWLRPPAWVMSRKGAEQSEAEWSELKGLSQDKHRRSETQENAALRPVFDQAKRDTGGSGNLRRRRSSWVGSWVVTGWVHGWFMGGLLGGISVVDVRKSAGRLCRPGGGRGRQGRGDAPPSTGKRLSLGGNCAGLVSVS